MATAKPVWTENVEIRAAATLAAASTSNHDIDLNTLGGDRSLIQVDILIGSASSVTVQVLNSSDSGTTYDTHPVAAYEVSANDIRSVLVETPNFRLSLTNNDGSNATGNVTAKHAWRQWDIT